NSVDAPDLVLTAFAAHLTSNPFILGLITPLQNATWSLPQIWTIGWLRRNRYALPLYHWSAVLRMISWIALTVVVFFARDATLLLFTLMLFVVMGGLAAGVTGLPFTEVVAKIIPARPRGLVFGWRGALGGALAIAGSPIVLVFTGPDIRFDFPRNYAVLFLVAGVTGLPFSEVVAKISPARQRGLVFGWRGALGGALAIVGSPIVLFFPGPDIRFDFPQNYALLFLVAGVTQMLGFFSFSLVKEPPDEPSDDHPPLSTDRKS